VQGLFFYNRPAFPSENAIDNIIFVARGKIKLFIRFSLEGGGRPAGARRAERQLIGCARLGVTTTGGGSVSLNPAGGIYAEGTDVTLTAVPAGDSVFAGWGGDMTGRSNPAVIRMTRAMHITAQFALNPAALRVRCAAGSIRRDSLTITNAGNATLVYSVSVPQEYCAWLAPAVTTGTVPSVSSSVLHVTCDATLLAPGRFSGSLTITHNAQSAGPVIVPVTFDVVPARDGPLASYILAGPSASARSSGSLYTVERVVAGAAVQSAVLRGDGYLARIH